MLITIYLEQVDRISSASTAGKPPVQWANSGSSEGEEHAIVFNDPDHFTAKVLPVFAFPPTSFRSFVRKLYRWGFRRTQSQGNSDAHKHRAFSCDNFQRGNFLRLRHMVSVDSRTRKPGKVSSIQPVSVNSVETRSSKGDTPSPNEDVVGYGATRNLHKRRKREHNTTVSRTTPDDESVSTTESSYTNETAARRVDRPSYIAVPKNLRKTPQTSFETKSAQVDKSSKPEQVVHAVRRPFNCILDSGTTELMGVSNVAQRSELELHVPVSYPPFLPTDSLSLHNENGKTNAMGSYPMLGQRPEQSRLPIVHNVGMLRRPIPVPARCYRLGPPFGPALSPRSTTGVPHYFQRQFLPTQQYPIPLRSRHEPSYTRPNENFSLSCLPLPADAGPSLSTSQSPPPMSDVSNGFHAAECVHCQAQSGTTACVLQSWAPDRPWYRSPPEYFGLNCPSLSSNTGHSSLPQSLLLEVLTRGRSGNDDFARAPYIHPQQQHELVLQTLEAVPQSGLPLVNSFLAYPSGSTILTSSQQRPTDKGDANGPLLLEEAISSMTREQLYAFFCARKGG
jgi:HSF-type DNA-binding